MNRADYERYLAAFNAKDYDAVCDFYAEPMDMRFFGVALQSREDMKRFYSFLHAHVHESVRVLNFASSDTLTAVDAIVRIEAYRDLDRATLDANGAGGLFPIKAGEVQEMRQFIFYTLRDGLIVDVACALAPPTG
ncbi:MULTISPECIES: nuclear transport factor 2 family protein [Sphingobium]|uniref:nuclear transport factor 2 family protein n=1 Tax=Sphingobium TaxID=165695 RepID=UPI0015EC64B4|nr:MULTISPECIES: nuclear transport factor 2 family protein [Sphingobium]MCW2362250.1 ketosteroid isomerase-like protein [Sphingobium sp. B10D3B]MCW2401071.1 ketosteroid isomerase-like protein [Sphingobium sp. B10D7B]MCW2408051.1 ketosteroid isomerase-like protein [Sphingobium xanthum]